MNLNFEQRLRLAVGDMVVNNIALNQQVQDLAEKLKALTEASSPGKPTEKADGGSSD